MENKARNLSSVSQAIRQTYRDFFDLNEPQAVMPLAQRELFVDQAFERHYRIAMFMANQEQPIAGHLVRRLRDGRFLLAEFQSNVTAIIDLAQVTAIQRV
ncbi:hypothetical protein [Lacticaseibacillus brantae]|uniref:Uncharacterized protein n=1 Tax=Lacticaseibacillus brantae DSM 23927 TaxID=1423727 RepID=A0A0R2AZW1_9LACO|nr:hypothetical protein [Lacticaseibacillus brantae]KRM72813.1 hypothetical protein FC34_GL000524 [Lacticaseibacillus brantae DSM 23927]